MLHVEHIAEVYGIFHLSINKPSGLLSLQSFYPKYTDLSNMVTKVCDYVVADDEIWGSGVRINSFGP